MRGWGTMTGRGSFPGWMTMQGFLTYYYDEVANAGKVEMNRCAFGSMGEDYNSISSSILQVATAANATIVARPNSMMSWLQIYLIVVLHGNVVAYVMYPLDCVVNSKKCGLMDGYRWKMYIHSYRRAAESFALMDSINRCSC